MLSQDDKEAKPALNRFYHLACWNCNIYRLLSSEVEVAAEMDNGKVNWQNYLKKVSKDVQIAERSLAHDEEVRFD